MTSMLTTMLALRPGPDLGLLNTTMIPPHAVDDGKGIEGSYYQTQHRHALETNGCFVNAFAILSCNYKHLNIACNAKATSASNAKVTRTRDDGFQTSERPVADFDCVFCPWK